MDKGKLKRIADMIEAPDGKAMTAAIDRQESLAKPPGSLGQLEELSIRLAGITGQVKAHVDKGCVMVFCADNGVAEEGVASAPQSVTAAQTMNFTRRLTGVGALADSFGDDLLIVDMGIKENIPDIFYDETGIPFRDTHRIIDRKIRPGTGNIAKGPAMSTEEVLRCIDVGIEMADAARASGYDMAGIGEMGIGNTTTSAAVLAGLTGLGAEAVTGRGGGVNDEGFVRKIAIADAAAERWRRTAGRNAPAADRKSCGNGAGSICTDQEQPISKGQPLSKDQPLSIEMDDVIELLAQAGGFDICAMTGAYIGAAKNRLPVVIDGYISAVAALAAAKISPKASSYMIASHKSAEPGYMIAIGELAKIREMTEGNLPDMRSGRLKPMLDLDMRLGEGSGCPIAFSIIRAACHVMNHMATFEEAAINDSYLEEVRKGGCF